VGDALVRQAETSGLPRLDVFEVRNCIMQLSQNQVADFDVKRCEFLPGFIRGLFRGLFRDAKSAIQASRERPRADANQVAAIGGEWSCSSSCF